VKGDILTTPHLSGVDIDGKLEFRNVLLVGTRDFSAIGRPVLPNAVVRVC
jgi:ribosomal protein L21